jgi:hypothetical protein
MLKKRDEILAKNNIPVQPAAEDPAKALKAFSPVVERVYSINLEGGAQVINMNGLLYGGMLNFDAVKYHPTDPLGKNDESASGYTARVGAFGNDKDFLVTGSVGFKYGTSPHKKWDTKLDINPSIRVDYSKSSGLMAGPEIGFGVGTNVPNLGNLYVRPYFAAMTNFKKFDPVVGVSIGIGWDYRKKGSE